MNIKFQRKDRKNALFLYICCMSLLVTLVMEMFFTFLKRVLGSLPWVAVLSDKETQQVAFFFFFFFEGGGGGRKNKFIILIQEFFSGGIA